MMDHRSYSSIMLVHFFFPISAIPSPSFQTVDNPSTSHTLERTVGTSVQLQLTSSLYPNVREIEWSWHSEPDKEEILVSWKPNATPDWYELEEKYRSSFSLTETAVLSIRNLTTDMSGSYTAKVKFHTGKSQKEVFKLCVYEPIPHPQIVIHSSSNQAGWCNVSLECGTPGATEIWTVTWLSEGLPRELEEREALGPVPSSRNLSLSLPLSQLNGPLTCRVSNPVDEKNATLLLQNICLWTEPQNRNKGCEEGSQSKWLWRGVLFTVLMLSLVCGVCIWVRKKIQSRRELGSAAVPQAPPTEEPAGMRTAGAHSHSPPDVEISLLRHPKNDTERDSCHPPKPECSPTVYTVYEKVRMSRMSQKDT
ncbi:T-lymphocyte surface antigen Ly-9-like isoform X1 [Lontra canadensis]|uniref:T-lymphocyte surface antigen Ly-9-like isoform X1 n=1 Tax=Lontra canadensis TaxID=76717 RepID=UPI0013F37020|nr:T-lymphocyte surface antigen Ly-9-like isoform X1 [Lontra canadensis]